MHIGVGSLLVGMLWWADYLLPTPAPIARSLRFDIILRYNVYTFALTAADYGPVRDLLVKAHRGTSLLTSFQVRIDGGVVRAEVKDLDQNRFPELYVYTASDGSGSFGQVYGWQFLPSRKADIRPQNWLKVSDGYMGHDSLWTDKTTLYRRFPVYRPGDANAQPSGGFRVVRYRLKPAGTNYALVAEN